MTLRPEIASSALSDAPVVAVSAGAPTGTPATEKNGGYASMGRGLTD